VVSTGEQNHQMIRGEVVLALVIKPQEPPQDPAVEVERIVSEILS
jgi:hypothetical protein